MHSPVQGVHLHCLGLAQILQCSNQIGCYEVLKFVKAVLSLFSSTFRVGRCGSTLAVEVTTLLAFSSVEEATLIWDGLRLLGSSSSEGEEGLSSVVTSGSGLRISGALCVTTVS